MKGGNVMKALSYLIIANVLVISLASFTAAEGLNVMHKSGQTFITWTEDADPDVKYNLYLSESPITMDKLTSAELAAIGIPSGTGADMIDEQAKPLAIQIYRKDELGTDWAADISGASPEKLAKPKHGYAISTFGSHLPFGTGLYVRNADKSREVYYAIAKTDASGKIIGSLITSDVPAAERPANPEPVLERLRKCDSGEIIKYYTHWSTKDIALKENMPFKFELQIGVDVGKSGPSPLVVLLHGGGGAETLPAPLEGNFILLLPNNYTPGFPEVYDFWYGYNTEIYTGNLKEGVNVNFTERRLLYMIDWVKSNYNIDENRIYLIGGSMGGTGSLNFGLRHPEIFAAIHAMVPHTNMGSGIAPHDSWFLRLWGKREEAIKTNEGVNIWDRFNQIEFVSNPKNNIPFVKTISSREDPAMPWVELPPFIKAMNTAKRAFVSGWGVGPHNIPLEYRPKLARMFDIYKIRKNESYPAFSNSSLNDDPGNGDAEDGTITGIMGGGFDWEILADTDKKWSAKISHIADDKQEAAADITPRNLQKFKVSNKDEYSYANTDSSGNIIQSGTIKADENGLLTISQVKITSIGNTITISR